MDNTFLKLAKLYQELPKAFVEEVIIPQMRTAANTQKIMRKAHEQDVELLVEKKLRSAKK